MTADVVSIFDYERPASVPVDAGASATVVVLPVVRVWRCGDDPFRAAFARALPRPLKILNPPDPDPAVDRIHNPMENGVSDADLVITTGLHDRIQAQDLERFLQRGLIPPPEPDPAA